MDRKYDIVLLGATGFTGKLCTEYMARNLPSRVKWAIAGRSQAKLEAVAKEFDVAGAGGISLSRCRFNGGECLTTARFCRLSRCIFGR